jgi:hypothetical protein
MNDLSKRTGPILLIVLGGFLPNIVEGFGVTIEGSTVLGDSLRIIGIGMIIFGLILYIKYLKKKNNV